MGHGVSEEFDTVDLLLQSNAETRAVDAFAISWVKLERQLRRLTANLVFQHSAFDGNRVKDKNDLREVFLEKRTANHNRFIGAIHRVSGISVKEVIGDQYRPLKREIDQAYKHRQKILHGQQTGQSLNRCDLEDCIHSIRAWCEALANGCAEQFGYDGFSRNSLRKNLKPDISRAVDNALHGGWKEFIRKI